jgi:gamma-glutamyltranspeptidase / glutathione hydrolase
MKGSPAIVWLILSAACASGGSLETTAPPDAGRRVVAEHGAVTSANPLASQAGLDILRDGGNAIDAAVATAFAIGVVEPQFSGLGGGGGMTIWLQAVTHADYIDFYPSQNAASYRSAFSVGLSDARPAPGDLRVTGVPGEVRGLLAAHERFGRLPLERVMAPAIRLAEDGFPVNQVLAEMILSDSAKLHRFEASAALMWPDGRPLGPGDRLRNPELASTLRAIARDGEKAFYEGPVAERVVGMLNEYGNPTTLADLAAYAPQWKRPLCGDYRGHVLLSAPPPQTGDQVLHTLELLEPFDMKSFGLPTRSARAFDVMASALRVGVADHRVNTDPRWQPMPAAGIASEAFARQRGGLVGNGRPPATVEPGDATPFDRETPPKSCAAWDPYGPSPAIAGVDAPSRLSPAGPSTGTAAGAGSGKNPARLDSGASARVSAERVAEPEATIERGAPDNEEHAETTHISVVDDEGNAVALTQTNSTAFGSGASVAGFFLNDSGFLFTRANVDDPSLSTWRTRATTISPTLVVKDGRVEMVVGAPGGGLIPTSIVQTMVYTLDYGMDPLEAVRMPRLFPTPNSTSVQLEIGFGADVLEQAKAMGWSPSALAPGYARLYMIVRRDDRWIAVADPRHNGEARGY